MLPETAELAKDRLQRTGVTRGMSLKLVGVDGSAARICVRLQDVQSSRLEPIKTYCGEWCSFRLQPALLHDALNKPFAHG